jgi:hypothetical protein
MLSGVAAAAAGSVRVAKQRPAVPPASNERRERRDRIKVTILLPV